MLPRSAFHENGWADAPLTTTPVTPARFRRANQRAEVPGILHVDRHQREAAAAIPDCRRIGRRTFRDRDNARRRAHGTHGGENLVGDAEHGHALGLERARECAFLSLYGETGRGDGDRLEAEPGIARVTHEMHAVEQQPRAVGIGLARQLAKRRARSGFWRLEMRLHVKDFEHNRLC